MENASKALIIAGAILISILLISLGIIMFNTSKGTTVQAGATGDLLEAQVGKTNDSIRDGLNLGGNNNNSEISFVVYYGKNTDWHEVIRARKGMTWEEFINSSYNTYGFYSNSVTGIVSREYSDWIYGVRERGGGTHQNKNMEIVSGGSYELYS